MLSWSIMCRESIEWKELNEHGRLFLFDRREWKTSCWTAGELFFLLKNMFLRVSPQLLWVIDVKEKSGRRINRAGGSLFRWLSLFPGHDYRHYTADALNVFPSSVTRCHSFGEWSEGLLFSKTFMDVLTTLFLIVWFIYGNHILYRYRLPRFEQTTEDPEHWCKKNVYLLTIISVAYTYALMTLMLFVVLIVVITVHLRNRRRNTGETSDAVCSWLCIHIYFFSINIRIITVTHKERESEEEEKTSTHTCAHALSLSKNTPKREDKPER